MPAARELCRQVGDAPQLFRVLGGLAAFHRWHGEYQTARELAEQCLTLAQAQADPTFRMRAHVDMAEPLFYLGEMASARAHLAQAIVLPVPQHGRSPVFLLDEGSMVRCLGYMARVLWKLGYPAQVLARAHEMLTYAQASSHAFTLMRALYYAGLIHMGRREIAAAQQRAEAVLALSTKQGFGLNMGYATFLRGWALAAQGQREEGLAQMHQGLATTRAMGAILGET